MSTNGFSTSSPWENHYPWLANSSYLRTPINEQLAHMKPPTELAQRSPWIYSSMIAGAAETTADVKEYQNSFVLEIDMAGLKSGDIKVEIEDDNILVISGERMREKGVKYLRMERKVGNLLRKFVLPENADTSAVSAACLDGLLTVTVMKKLPPPETNKNKRIKVVEVA